MKRSIQTISFFAFLFAAFAFTSAPVSNNAVATLNQDNEGRSSGYEFPEIETAKNDLDRSNGYEFPEVETAKNDQDRSNGYEFPEVETA